MGGCVLQRKTRLSSPFVHLNSSLAISKFQPYDDKTMDRASSILPNPPQPGILKQCPHCRRLFALREVRLESDSRFGEVRVYLCTACGRELKFVKSLPPHVV